MTGPWSFVAGLLMTTCPPDAEVPPSVTTGLEFIQTGPMLSATPIPGPGGPVFQGLLTSAADFTLASGAFPVDDDCTLAIVFQGTVVTADLVDPAIVTETNLCTDNGRNCFAIYAGRMVP